jgi:hypothetical protein
MTPTEGRSRSGTAGEGVYLTDLGNAVVADRSKSCYPSVAGRLGRRRWRRIMVPSREWGRARVGWNGLRFDEITSGADVPRFAWTCQPPECRHGSRQSQPWRSRGVAPSPASAVSRAWLVGWSAGLAVDRGCGSWPGWSGPHRRPLGCRQAAPSRHRRRTRPARWESARSLPRQSDRRTQTTRARWVAVAITGKDAAGRRKGSRPARCAAEPPALPEGAPRMAIAWLSLRSGR